MAKLALIKQIKSIRHITLVTYIILQFSVGVVDQSLNIKKHTVSKRAKASGIKVN